MEAFSAMFHVGKCVAVLCLLGFVCTAMVGGSTLTSNQMMPGIEVVRVASPVSNISRRRVNHRPRGSGYVMPSRFEFLRSSWQDEDAHLLNDIADTDNDDFSAPLILNGVNFNEVAPVVFPGDEESRGGRGPTPTPPGDDEPKSLNFDELSMNDQLMMSNVETMEDFARMMGVSLPPSGGGTVAASTAAGGIAARFGGPGDDGMPAAVSANCGVENRTVVLKLVPELNVVYFPTCVRLQRCGGCCVGPLLKCMPTSVQEVKLKVMKIDQKEGEEAPQGRSAVSLAVSTPRRRRPKPEGSRSRRDATTSYEIITEAHHLTCSCQCRVQEEDCTSAIHDYVPNECRCACKNIDEMEKCEQKSETHYWSHDDCMCYCFQEESCSTGQLFDHNTCSCKTVDIRSRAGMSGISIRRGTGVPDPVAFPAP